jgi:steroid 5-alpha reductase family enzyme
VTKAYAWVTAAYVAAFAAAVWVVGAYPDMHPVARVLAADVAATLVVFAFSFAFGNSSFYDPYWSVVPPLIAVYWAAASSVADTDSLRSILAIGLVFLWGTRLTFNWCRGWTGLDHEDWRYVDLQEKTGKLYWGVSLGGIHMLPTLWVFGGCLSLWPALAVGTRPFGALDVVATAVTAGAIWLEARADKELVRFRNSDRKPEDVLSTGVWAWSRHPNYFGEMSFWWGLFLFGLAADPVYWWTAAGPLAITLMFLFVSLPMMEERMVAKRPAFAEHQQRSSLVVPWPPVRTS